MCRGYLIIEKFLLDSAPVPTAKCIDDICRIGQDFLHISFLFE